MRRLALWLLATFAFLRFLSWKRAQAVPPAAPPAHEPVAAPEPETDPRAEELRAKLEAREEPAAEPVPEPVPEPDERRRSVHERGRRAAEQMRDSSSGE
ncbi:MAG: hypothetical protein ACXVZ3_06290 [Gaiellaceae bacterium]